MLSTRPVHMIVYSEQIASRRVVAACVRSRQRDLRSTIRSRASRNHNRSHRRRRSPIPARSARHDAVETKCRSRIPDAQPYSADWARTHAAPARSTPAPAAARKSTNTDSPKASSHRCRPSCKPQTADPSATSSRRCASFQNLRAHAAKDWRTPPQFRHQVPSFPTGHSASNGCTLRNRSGARSSIRNKRHITQAKVLPIPLIVRKSKQLVMPQRPSQRSTKIIALKLAESAPGQSSCAHPARCCAKTHTPNHAADSARSSNDRDLRTGPLSIVRAVRIAHHVELAHRFHAQQLPACPTRRHVDQRSARILNAIQ